jgi:X-Pro dipeptidyl-peptidase
MKALSRIFLSACLLGALVLGATPVFARPTASSVGKVDPQMERGARSDMDILDPVRFKLDDAITGHRLITARDGVTSLAIDVIRPDTNEKVPTIYLQSPYYNTVGRGYLHETKTPWGFGGTPADPSVPFPEWYDEYFVERGYAVVMSDMRGTRNSSGCQVYGGREEATDAVDVIEWIAEQEWSNGKVGMTGGSYDGTVAIAAASEAPKALKAIIPIRAIDRWYDYHFFNGVQSSQHLLTPWNFTTLTTVQDNQNSLPDDTLFPLHLIERKACAASLGALVSAQYSTPYQDSTSPFWADRDWLRNVEDFQAATFIIHGLNDTNVKTTNASNLWSALPKTVEKKLWWARMGHADPKQPEPGGELSFPFDARFVDATHRWFAQFLKGIDTGILDEPRVSVQDRDGHWQDLAQWPPPGRDVIFGIDGDELVEGSGKGKAAYGRSAVTVESKPLEGDLHLAGEAYMKFAYSLERGGDTTFAYRLEDVGPKGATEITTAYARGAYRDDIAKRGPSYPTLPIPHLPGERYRITFPFLPQDYVVPAGHRLRLVIAADDGRVLGDSGPGEVTLYRPTLVIPASR